MSERVEEVFTRLGHAQVVGVLRGDTGAREQAEAALKAGLVALEVTFSTPNAADLVQQLRANHPDKLIGVGTARTAEHLEQAAASGAQFAVSPHLEPMLVEHAFALGLPYVPGTSTPTEIVEALSLGCTMLKLFPIRQLGGVSYVKSLLGPYPELHLMVTGGVKPEEVSAYLQAGAKTVGLGSLFTDDAEETKSRVQRVLNVS